MLAQRPASAKGKRVVISTWDFGVAANLAALEMMVGGGTALDAVESGARVPEGDPNVQSVGWGGRPDEDGHVTLDACIMDWQGRAGSVAFLQDIMHPISVARKVMERSDHIMLVGDGAKRFALAHGFSEENLLTESSRQEWLKWRESLSEQDNWGPANYLDHDTIAILALDKEGRLAGACTTSGLAYKLHGRIGDSPIIGAGMYCDGEIGAAGATGRGEEVIRTAGSFLVVELMRQGRSAQEACEEALGRIIRRRGGKPSFQVAFIALRADGQIGAAAIHDGFDYALSQEGKTQLIRAEGLVN